MVVSPAVEVVDLRHRYEQREALAGVSMQVERGEVFGLLGPNGGGKSTLFRILSTLLLPSSGQARICGVDAARDPHGVRRHICVVFQNPSLDGRLKVIENLRHQGRLYGLRGADLERRIAEGLEKLGLAARALERVDKLSGGQQRRVELCKALLHRPEVLLLDEPTTGLDPGVRLEIWDLLMELRRQDGLTVFISTHLLEEAERCDRVAILHQGRIVATGVPSQLRAAIGADVLLLRGPDRAALADFLRSRFAVEGKTIDGALRIEHPEGAQLLVSLLQEGQVKLDAVSLGKPTLEDVFLHHTGMTLQQGLDSAENGGRRASAKSVKHGGA